MPTHRYFLPDFIEIQRESFLNFLKKGILEEFSKRNPITNNNKSVEIFFYSEYFCLTKPKYSIQQAIFFKKSYVSKLYIPIQYTDKNKKLIFLKWILIAELPLMTKRGHFVLNGAARVIINQLVRSPGVYFRENFYEIYFNKWASKPSRILQRFYADIICLKGTWVRIEIQKDFSMWVRFKKGPKIPLLWFLLGMGLNEKMIFQSVISPNFLLENFNKKNALKYPYVATTPEAWKEIAKLFNLKKIRRSALPKAMRVAQRGLGEALATVKKDANNLIFQTNGLISVTGHFPSSNIVISNDLKSNFYKTKYQNHLETNQPNIKKIKESVHLANLGRKWFFQRFMNPRTYDLGKKGRLALNQKLGLTILPNQTTLTAQDLLFITDYLMKVEKGIYPVDDIDHLKNKRIRSAGELIQMQFGIGLMRLEKTIRLKLNTKSRKNQGLKATAQPHTSFFSLLPLYTVGQSPSTGALCSPSNPPLSALPLTPVGGDAVSVVREAQLPPKGGLVGERSAKARKKRTTDTLTVGSLVGHSPRSSIAQFVQPKEELSHKQNFTWLNSLIQPKFVNGALKEFFGTHPLSQFMDQINPLAEITHKRRLTSLGPGGVSRDSATLAIRGIHPSHYGRICPIETPEGKNTGLVNSLTVYARVNEEGFILSPFYSLYKAQIQKSLGKIYLSAAQEENFQIATPDLNITNKNFLPRQKIPVRSGKNFFNGSAENLSFMGISPLQMISVATSLIPFLEHDDANRALMGSNMQRQAVPLIKPERPFIGTGLEAKAISDSGYALTTSKSGFVLYASGSQIILYINETF